MPKPDRQRLLKNMRIPTLPAHVEKLTQLIDTPNAGSAEVGALLKEDPPIAGRVLRVANSSFYGLSEPCTSIEQAATILGLRLLRNIVVQAALIERYTHLHSMGLNIERLWQRAVLTGRISTVLARCSKSPSLPSADEAYLTGLLSDIGQVVLLDNLGEEYVAIHSRALQHSLPLHYAERRDLGATHAEVGAMVASSWGLPNVVRCGIELHHGRRGTDHAIPAVYLVIRSGQILERVSAGDLIGAAAPVDADSEKSHGITPQAIEEAIEYARANLDAPLLEAA
jgi:HD-like signal output (HDOD) protein